MPPVMRDSGGPQGRPRLASPCPAFPNRAGRMPAVGLASRDSLCEPQDAASGARPADNDELWASLSPE